MKTSETEIRRLSNGLIDTDHYIRHCRHQRSLGAHRIIAQVYSAVARALTGRPGAISPAAVVVETPAQPIELSIGQETERKAA